MHNLGPFLLVLHKLVVKVFRQLTKLYNFRRDEGVDFRVFELFKEACQHGFQYLERLRLC
jgi:hypothetical protein